uniref:Uncharacterized protein n=1 Tax=Arundo donax TaxID=35708 RepID=A0A0A9E154_ARUDO
MEYYGILETIKKYSENQNCSRLKSVTSSLSDSMYSILSTINSLNVFEEKNIGTIRYDKLHLQPYK